MDFTHVKELTIPEGSVKQITDSLGRVLWKKAEPIAKYKIRINAGFTEYFCSYAKRYSTIYLRPIENSYAGVYNKIDLQNGNFMLQEVESGKYLQAKTSDNQIIFADTADSLCEFTLNSSNVLLAYNGTQVYRSSADHISYGVNFNHTVTFIPVN